MLPFQDTPEVTYNSSYISLDFYYVLISNPTSWVICKINKNAFQLDAYRSIQRRPLGGVGVCPWGFCCGVSAVGGVRREGVYLRGFDCTGMCWPSRGVWPGGLLGVVSAGRGCLPHPLLKHYLFATVAVINHLFEFIHINHNKLQIFRVK